MEPLDLTVKPPRGCYEELDGLMFMPRTIDKIRATLDGGKMGVYIINARVKGISGFLLERLGITEAELRDAVQREPNDEAIAAWLRTRVDSSLYPKLNATMSRIEAQHASEPEFVRNLYRETMAEHTELARMFEIIEADDRRMFPQNVSS
jgi:Domain of unknown function (DUF5069)